MDKSGISDNFNSKSVVAAEHNPFYIREWNELMYEMIAHFGISPPEASRYYAYFGIAAYEAVIGGMPNHKSVAGQLSELEAKMLPRSDKNQVYDWPSVLAECVYQVMDELLAEYLSSTEMRLKKLREVQIQKRKLALDNPEVISVSKAYGKKLGLAIVEWSRSDGFDDTRYKNYKAAPRSENPANWEPTDLNQQALEPYWSELRPFAIENTNVCSLKPSIEFDTIPESSFYNAAMEVYSIDRNLKEEDRVKALFWADCPGETATPPGHWGYIMTSLYPQLQLSLEDAVEMHCLVGIAIADAFIQCWKTKYDINLIRPVTYIKEYTKHKNWEPLVYTPPFPEYPSGHSVVTGAAAKVLSELLGNQISFVDSTQLKIGLEPRSFNSFKEAAEEAAFSRLYGGIHYRIAVTEGLEQGECVGTSILNQVQLKR